MKVVFTEIRWRNQDVEIFNMHALKSIELDGLESGIVTITGVSNRFQAPYCKLCITGGFTHYEFTVKHPFEMGVYINIAIFENGTVAIRHEPTCCVPAWFQYKSKTYVASF